MCVIYCCNYSITVIMHRFILFPIIVVGVMDVLNHFMKMTSQSSIKCPVEWDDNRKSHAAKDILMKSVAQLIHVYVMNVFKLPMVLCD